MDALCLSLGHNSSAILIRDGRVVGGYETERLSHVKSDSTFPKLAIEHLDKRFGLSPDVELMVGHWALDGHLHSMSTKHWDAQYISTKFPKSQIQSLDRHYFTHHDSHAFSAMVFAGPEFCANDTHILVMDGFGTMGEHISVYKLYGNVPVLQWRKFGFGTSMGLLYQYTTAFLGMKQNQDEYKLLAFEAHIEDALTYVSAKKYHAQIKRWSDYFINEIELFSVDPSTDPLCNIAALPEFANRVASIHASLLDTIDYVNMSDRVTKILVAYFTQKIVENVVTHIVNRFGFNNVILSGGLFYNVKVNSLISRLIKGKICVMPLAGDQGAALGIYHAKYSLRWPGDLFWGHRALHEVPDTLPEGVFTAKDSETGLSMACEVIRNNGFVNVVRGPMEFGPRALCNTTTFADPKDKISEYINELNNRVNEMPFAPVVTPGVISKIFKDTDKVHRSLGYMIITRDYNEGYGERNRYAAHNDPDRSVYTGRPQLTNDPYLVKMLSQFDGILVNTSYNYHGVPIVNGWDDILYTHNKQCSHAIRGSKKGLPITIVVTGD